ncbi:Rv2175c family DNA-binding protein [Humibacter ginsengisoli]
MAKPSSASAQSQETRTEAERTWLTVPELVDVLGVGVGRVHRLLEDKHLLATRVDGVLKVPSDFIAGDEPLSELRGTLIVLADAGFSDSDAMSWLLQPEDSLGVAPIDALRAGRKAEVRRIAQALG